jgi:hypothetical protein
MDTIQLHLISKSLSKYIAISTIAEECSGDELEYADEVTLEEVFYNAPSKNVQK